MCLPLSGYAKRAGRGLEIIQFPNLDRHEEIWERKVEIAAKAGEQWAAAEMQRRRLQRRPGAGWTQPTIAIGKTVYPAGFDIDRTNDLLRELVSWEYPLHLGAFAEGAILFRGNVELENGLKQPRLPDWWDADYADELFAHIDHICHDAETLYEWMRKNEVVPTEEHWKCITPPGAAAVNSMLAVSRPQKVTGVTIEEICVAINAINAVTGDYGRQLSTIWYTFWEDPANRIPAWRTEREVA